MPEFGLTVPAPQEVHAVAPASEKAPAGQLVQPEDPDTPWNVPSGQLLQTAAPAVENEPFAHVEQDDEPAAALIKARLARGDARIAFPWPVYWGARLAGALPARVQQLLTARWPGKE